MTNEQILEKQVEALEKLLQLRTAIIEELEQQVSKLQAEKMTYPFQPTVTNTPWFGTPQINPNPFIGAPSSGTITISNTCPDGSPHEYPNMWSGITGAHCKRCGATQGIVTSASTTGCVITSNNAISAQIDPNATLTGNVLTLLNAAK